ncbi:Hsp33 family molecular chaperone HslO [Granulicatella elegans]|uniref:33 kDa chaperonin n=2 Tax=Granulicatella elegans TaxID=137732 RepID=D0BM54_9LACT|nr:Hsp33 family molecular chaperone HslO [Granulicatella elegans]EEW93069.1 hypothetical protein HMPREF0446_01057 [Granulicatella elegans ATCC 700633]MBF0993319.1 Hsp33 family molecular chaperone HslO [Granulicatella sp.]RKW27643.1 MAG: Hsp33 family molecular chaperone HslO [Granulicatella sp.]
MKDHLLKVLAFNDEVKAVAIVATEAVSQAQKRHDTWSAATAALGRTMIGTQLLATSLKGKEKITVQVNGDGPGGKIMAEANGLGQMRGYISNPHVSLPLNEKGKLDVRGVVGTNGTITVIKDLQMKEPFSGQIPIVDGELGMDFTYYLAVSEQINGAVGVSVLVNPDESVRAAGGFMIQLLPGASEETIVEIERRISEMPLVSKLIDQQEEPIDLLNRLLGKENIKVLEELPVEFHCPCTRERFSAGLLSIGVEDLQHLIDEDHGAEIVCHFCGEKYQFSEDDLNDLITEIKSQKK